MDHDQNQSGEMTQAEAADIIARRLDEHDEQLNRLAAQFAGLQQARNDLQDVREEVRAMAASGLAAAIASIAAEGRAASDHERAIARAAHEVAVAALTGVPRHGDVTSAGVGIRREHGWLTVSISDNGSGGATDDDKHVLDQRRQRVSALRGHLTLTGASGEGTTVLVALPREPSG